MPKVFNFQTQLRVGNVGEKMFLSKYKDYIKSKDLKYDFINGKNKTVELKSDSYSMEDTPNFFMEHYGNVEKQSIGGSFRAKRDNITHFVYLFIPEKTFFWFEPISLCNYIEAKMSILKPCFINNSSYSAMGYKIPRADVEFLLVKKDVIK